MFGSQFPALLRNLVLEPFELLLNGLALLLPQSRDTGIKGNFHL
jgi:hypothetical protein